MTDLREQVIYEGFESMQDRVLVKPAEAEQKTAGGLIIPETVRDRPSCGIVVGYGDLTRKLNINDKVLYGQHAGFPVNIKGKEYLLIRENDVYVRVHE